MNPQEIRPQPTQNLFLSSPADIAIFGGSAGGGKSFALLLEPLRHIHNGPFRALIFRRTVPMLRQQGGLWDESAGIYSGLGAVANQATLTWKFKSGATIQFAGMESPQDRYNFQGLQVSYLGFDELTLFEPE